VGLERVVWTISPSLVSMPTSPRIPDLALSEYHPKRRFMRRALELEIRLSYFERISKTLPDQMQDLDAQALPPSAPGPNFRYDDPGKSMRTDNCPFHLCILLGQPHHDAAQSVLNLLRGRAKVEDVISHLDSLKSNLETSEDMHINVDRVVRSIAIQSLLNIGSRSFSHLLNAIERYLPLLRSIATGTASTSGQPESKAEILSEAASFWKHNSQMVEIVFDKLMQYQIVDPTDIVLWTFANEFVEDDKTNASHYAGLNWDLLKAAIDKANGRVLIAKAKVAALRKEDDETRARENAGVDMEIDTEAKPGTMTKSPIP
jgi:nuclear cap-binding protein subunit 1